MLEKKQLRTKILEEKKDIPQETIDNASEKIKGYITNLIEFKNAKTVLVYSALSWEIATDFIWDYKEEKQIVFPKVEKGNLRLIRVKNKDQLKPGVMGILEPVALDEVSPKEIDFVIVPGIAYDMNGFRLGYGGGYYDKLLPLIQGVKVGVVLERYRFANNTLPTENHDIPVDLVVSEAGLFWR